MEQKTPNEIIGRLANAADSAFRIWVIGSVVVGLIVAAVIVFVLETIL